MIVVTVDMWPQGDETKKYRLGRTYIWNTNCSSDLKRADYGVAVMRKGMESESPQVEGAVTRHAEVKGYPRLSYNMLAADYSGIKSSFCGRKVGVDGIKYQSGSR